MVILTGLEITRVLRRTRAEKADGSPQMSPALDIVPFYPERAGPNSYDVSLDSRLLCYDTVQMSQARPGEARTYLDPREPNSTHEIIMPEEGIVLRAGVLYLGSTIERTMTAGLVPWMDGRSSIGRLGLAIHITAGKGDDGFGEEHEGGCSWTLEMIAAHPIKVYPGMRIGQITYFTMVGERNPYRNRKYSHQVLPTASKLHEDK